MTSQINSPVLTDRIEERAQYLSNIADGISVARPVAGAFIANHVLTAEDYHSWPVVAAHGAIAIGDKLDGFIKRWAMNLSPKVSDNPMLDDLTDKGYFYEVAGALQKREKRDGNTVSNWILGKAIEVNFVRDVPVTLLRLMAKNEGIKVNAGDMGKAKTLIGHIGIGILLSPAAKSKPVKAIGLGFMTANAAASAASGALYAKRFTKELRLKKVQKRHVY
jgi:phosphatidylglycerophosphate synthase